MVLRWFARTLNDAARVCARCTAAARCEPPLGPRCPTSRQRLGHDPKGRVASPAWTRQPVQHGSGQHSRYINNECRQVTDRLAPDRRSLLMQAVKREDTAPEIALRSLLHRLGYRFRLHRRNLPGTPDIVLPARHTVVFVNGCFWHGHGCSIGKLPKSRLDFWEPKIEANKARDASRQAELINLGWSVIVVWQCELRDMPTLTERLTKLLGPPAGTALR